MEQGEVWERVRWQRRTGGGGGRGGEEEDRNIWEKVL